MTRTMTLLRADEPAPVETGRLNGSAPFVLVCDHGGNRIPAALEDLGLTPEDRARHIAVDIGAADVTRRLSDHLDAPMVVQTYSRLVVDCNRQPHWATAMPEISETTVIPGNRSVSPQDRAARTAALFRPYHDTIVDLLDRRAARGLATVLIAMHSFTPVFKGQARPWHVGILYNRDRRLAAPLLDLMAAEPGLVVGDNQPYRVDDDSDYTIPVHGEQRGLVHVEIEMRQDLLGSAEGRAAWAARLARLLPAALSAVTDADGPALRAAAR